MKFEVRLGNIEVRQERNNWKEEIHKNHNYIHIEPEKEFKAADINLVFELEIDEVIQMCKSTDLSIVEIMKLMKDLGPQILDMIVKKQEDDLKDLRDELKNSRSRTHVVSEKYNDLVKKYNDLLLEKKSAMTADKEKPLGE